MPLDPKASQEAIAWLQKAEADLASSEVLLASRLRSQLHQVLFHCQQAVEKSLKDFLVLHQKPFRWTHDIAEIGNQCATLDRSLEAIVEEVKYLSDYAWEYRYPGESTDPKIPEARAALAAARKVFSSILRRVPDEVRHPFARGGRKSKAKAKDRKKKPSVRRNVNPR